MSELGPMTTIDGKGIKTDWDKLRADLFPGSAFFEICKVLTFGQRKYGSYNWARGMLYSRLFGATLRHLWAWWMGEKLDPETNCHHLAHAVCCIIFVLHYELRPNQYEDKNLDDRQIN